MTKTRLSVERSIWPALLATAICWLLLPVAARATAVHAAYAEAPSHTEPYAACPRPAPGHARCLAIVDPRPSTPTPLTAASRSAAPAGSDSEVFCREVFPGSEDENCGSGADHGFSAQDLESAYRLPSKTAGSEETVAIVDAYDDPHAQADLNVYRSTYGLPPCEAGCFAKVNQEGGATYPTAETGWALEISLDLDMVSAACPQCRIVLVEANDNTIKNLGIAENEAAKLGVTEISNSYSANEVEMGKAQVEEDGKYYEHPEVSITAASGDESWDDTNPCIDREEKCINVSPNFPAGLATVLAVGGTNLEPEGTSGRGWRESVWFYSGSGCTLYVSKPAWQTDKGCANRTDNDVSAVAEGVSMYDTYTADAGWHDVGGTSVSTPLTAGAIALENGVLRAKGAEGIYKHPGNWFDVTSGLNHARETCAEEYLCDAETGYDGPSGIGAPDGMATATSPSAWTEPASAVTETTATFNGIANPEAGSETTYYFQYGASTYYGRTAPAGGAKVSGYTQPSSVSQAVSGLKPATEYHFRVVVQNANGTAYGADQTFSTAPKIHLSKFGVEGSAEGDLDEPQFTAVNAEGDVWVSDYANDRIEEFSASGTFMRSCGKAGTGEVQFNGPTGIAISLNGQLYISDSGNNRIEVLSQECNYSVSFGKSYLTDPMGLTFTASGESTRELVLVANAGANTIDEFDPTDEKPAFVAAYGFGGTGEGQFADPTDVILAGKESPTTQTFYVVDSGNDRVQEFSESGLYTFGGEEKVSFKFIDAFGSKGSGGGEFTDPTAAALDPSTGDLAVTDTGDDRVEEFLPNGTYITAFGAAGSGEGSFDEPKGIATGPAGKLYIADTLNDRVTVWGSSETTDPEWFITTTRNPAKTLDSYLWSVSCVKETTGCSAVGEYTTKEGGKSEPMAEWWNGTEWVLQAPPSPSEYSSLFGVSCATTSWCMGVGLYKNEAGTYLPLTERWNGTKWAIKTVPEPSGALGSGLNAVSCTSSGECTAVGEYENSSLALIPFAERWNSTEWKVQSMPTPTGAKEETYATGVSCTASTACTEVGTYKNGSSVYVPYAETWNGSEWKAQSMPTPAGATATRMHGGVSCTASTACTGVGYYVNGSGTEVTLAERWNGTEWSIQSTPNPAGAKSSLFSGVSCTSTTACTAVGVSQNSSSKWVTLAEQWNGSEWKVASTPNGERGEGWLSGGVSCAADPLPCMAVGNTGATLAELYG